MTNPANPEVAILNTALELPAERRAAYLDQTCAGDSGLRQRVEALLKAHEEAGGFMETQPADHNLRKTILVTVPLTEKPGDKIGRYKLLQQIGEGGCGVVYMAEQEEPVRRRVALKVIKLGMDTKSVIARFEAERQALALMDHPNIAKVLDAGATETGRPYFVMELVRGIKITDYCDQSKLSTRERLDLFVQICRAIQHAHQKGIIHRDIKPSNILITVNDGVPVPKVIDFGIAKATQGRLTDKTLFTAFEQFIGTPAYMSPEQAEMTSLDIDTRSDIYSLGVLLYELLTGKTPFDANELLQAGLDEMRRTIREIEPPKPSTRLSIMLDAERTTTASHRQTDPPQLIHLVRGDLDWIVMKSLEKDRARRYETANALVADINRHLNNEPVVARPPSALYRFQKSLRRNKRSFTIVAAVACSLVIGLSVSKWVPDFRRWLHQRDTVECLGMTLVNSTAQLRKQYQLPETDEYRGPIILQVPDVSVFQFAPKPGCTFWIIEHPAYGSMPGAQDKFPSRRPKTVRELIEAILSCTVAPEEYKLLSAKARLKITGMRDVITTIQTPNGLASFRGGESNSPGERERLKLPRGDEGKYVCRVVYNTQTAQETMTTYMWLTKEDMDQLRELLKKLPP
jgi:serine/threonine protein kinase